LVGSIMTVDDGPNCGRQAVYLKSPDGFVVEFLGDKPA
jgi:hypothetical protein